MDEKTKELFNFYDDMYIHHMIWDSDLTDNMSAMEADRVVLSCLKIRRSMRRHPWYLNKYPIQTESRYYEEE